MTDSYFGYRGFDSRPPGLSPVYRLKFPVEMGRECSTIGEMRNAYRILVGKQEGKRLLGRLRRRWVENIEMDLKGI
jgi:hypothetical protein